MLDGHKSEAERWNFEGAGQRLLCVDPLLAIGKLDPALDPRITFRAWIKTLQCWLALAAVCAERTRCARPPYGWNRMKEKIPSANLFRFFTPSELADVYFLVLLEFLSAEGVDRIERFRSVIDALCEMRVSAGIRRALADIQNGFADGSESGPATIQKRLDRTRLFLLNQGFSHIRIDLLSGQVRLCPLPREIDANAALSLETQPGVDIPTESVAKAWRDAFGKPVFFEIAIDHRVNQIHRRESRRSNNRNASRKTNPNAPKHGIVVMPALYEIQMAFGVIP